MQRFLILQFIICSLVACGGARNIGSEQKTPSSVEVKEYGVEVVRSYPHSQSSYTQGLQYVDGELWEGTGQNGESVLQILDLESGKTNVVARLACDEFGEGITVLGDEVFFLTWMSNTAHVYNRHSFKEIRQMRYVGEGWGLTTDGEWLYMSNGSSSIDCLSPKDFSRKRRISVSYEGEPLDMLNELEWIDGKIWANVYLSDQIVIINPESGVVEAVVDCTGLLPQSERTPKTDVLNGIAYDKEQQRVLLTGKNWSKIFEVKLVQR